MPKVVLKGEGRLSQMSNSSVQINKEHRNLYYADKAK